jgi:NADPH-dependent ferric siderophore reductase
MSNAPGRTPPRLLRVRRIHDITPQLRRITLAGEALAGFPVGSEGAHVKLLLAREGQTEPILPTLGRDGPIWPPADVRPIARTYSVSRHDPAAGELDVDFVLHGDNGPASRWAGQAQVGHAIGVAGPGGPDRFQPGADWYLLVGDPSAYALLLSVLKALPSDAHGLCLMEVPDRTEIPPLPHPRGIELIILSREGRHAGDSTLLVDAVRAMRWAKGRPSVTIAGENSQVVAIRDHLLQDRGIAKQDMYAVPYWKDHFTEEAYHAERHRIMDEMEQ